ncbi:hypothetical protein RZS08_60205, partial [Arthrospira platensis SPKY1]|nr:hypothetical protein [Arthrospira platensis SPKY1]
MSELPEGCFGWPDWSALGRFLSRNRLFWAANQATAGRFCCAGRIQPAPKAAEAAIFSYSRGPSFRRAAGPAVEGTVGPVARHLQA